MPYNTLASSAARGYGAAWRKLRAAVLKRDQYLCKCETCKQLGRVRIASEVDHVRPKAKGGTDSMENLQAINSECHKAKTKIETGARPPKQRVGLDGWPL
jgi:5-methylcytosine-specific restriction protein A